MRRLLTTLPILGVLVFGLMLTAQAHSFDGEGDCTGWTLELDGTFEAHTILINGQPQAEVTTEYFVVDNRPGVTSRTFTVTWDKAQDDVTRQMTLTRDLGRCVDFTYNTECGTVSSSLTNETALNYAVAIEEGTATYNLGNAVFGSSVFVEDYNGGTVDVFLYVVGAEADFVTGRGIPNFWEQNAVQVTVDTDCVETSTTTIPEEPTTTAPPVTTTAPPATTTPGDTVGLDTWFNSTAECQADGGFTLTVEFGEGMESALVSLYDPMFPDPVEGADIVLTPANPSTHGSLGAAGAFIVTGTPSEGYEITSTNPLTVLVDDCPEVAPTSVVDTTNPGESSPSTLPFTGVGDSLGLAFSALALIGLGALMLRGRRGEG